ncbi:MAG: cytochrome c biogenesis protein [Mangrovibacterium sp.]
MNWSVYSYFLFPAILFWLTGGLFALIKTKWNKLAPPLFLLGTLTLLAFAIGLWISFGRPPMRTMGETRLWYAIYISLVGFFVYKKWAYNWMLSYSAAMAIVFSSLIFFMPEVQNKNLMPALQSPWFVPHVSVYIISYALLAAAMLMAVAYLWRAHKGQILPKDYTHRTDRMAYAGVGFLMLGLIMGALWAKEVWANYWSWDPKETWAFATCSFYLLYIHLRKTYPKLIKLAMILLIIAFISLLITWKGVNYLPSARGSMHSYSQT